MSYARVIPRDLFNESSLLKCYGKLWIWLENKPQASLEQTDDGDPFEIVMDQNDGSLTIANVKLTIRGFHFHLFRPMNSREAWPLYTISATEEEISVFTESGDLSPEFQALLN